jgi:hypothetical protein
LSDEIHEIASEIKGLKKSVEKFSAIIDSSNNKDDAFYLARIQIAAAKEQQIAAKEQRIAAKEQQIATAKEERLKDRKNLGIHFPPLRTTFFFPPYFFSFLPLFSKLLHFFFSSALLYRLSSLHSTLSLPPYLISFLPSLLTSST